MPKIRIQLFCIVDLKKRSFLINLLCVLIHVLWEKGVSQNKQVLEETSDGKRKKNINYNLAYKTVDFLNL